MMKKRRIEKIGLLLAAAIMSAAIYGCGASNTADSAVNGEETETVDTGDTEETAVAGIDTVSEKNKEAAAAEPTLKEKIAAMQITYRFDDMQETLDGETISEWLVTLADGSISVNEAPAKEYVASLASKYDTFGRSRSFTTHEGENITVAGGDYGYWMDRVSTRQELIAQILTGESAEMTPVYYGTAAHYGDDDVGDTYVEINLTEQHLWVYQNGQQVNESDFVSGGLFKGNNTPDGTYAITYKERDATLVGQGYQSAVKYWMPFNGNIGMHDASWRSTFGGHIYYTNGSHGCINLPPAKAAEIYDQVEKGEAVVVYGGISKDQAIATLSTAEKIEAMQKGYIPMTVDAAAYLLEQQGLDPETARAQAEAQQAAQALADQAAAQQAAIAEQQAAALQAAQAAQAAQQAEQMGQ